MVTFGTAARCQQCANGVMRQPLWLLPLWLCTAEASTPVTILRCCAQDAGRCKTDGNWRLPNDVKISDGKPDCGSHQLWPIHHESPDSLELLPGGVLRHYVKRHGHEQGFENDREELDGVDGAERHYDYSPGTYCVGEVILILHAVSLSTKRQRSDHCDI